LGQERRWEQGPGPAMSTDSIGDALCSAKFPLVSFHPFSYWNPSRSLGLEGLESFILQYTCGPSLFSVFLYHFG
jgi:hypothetical protein